MPGLLPESYRRLASFSSRVPAGIRLYDQGAVPDEFFIVLAGEVAFEVLSEDGEAETVASAGPGELVGHIAAFTGRPTSAAARVDRETVVLRIPVARLSDALREAPDLGVHLVYEIAGREAPDEAREESNGTAGEGESMRVEVPDGVVPLDGGYPEAQFFADIATCPVSRTQFQYLRAWTRAVRPTGRDSDFHVRYSDVNPTWYGVVVCPSCAYAAYHDDFDSLLDETVRQRLWEERDDRLSSAALPHHGVRSLGDGVRALELAMRCYEARDTSYARRALLLHRRAWLARDGGQADEEIAWLRRAREAYVQAYEHDTSLSEEAAARLAYLVGDLAYRLDDLTGAAQWLETAVRGAPSTSSGIARTARDRLQDVRDEIKRTRLAS